MTTLVTASSERLLNRVPKITVDFWLLKLLAVTVNRSRATLLQVVQRGTGA